MANHELTKLDTFLKKIDAEVRTTRRASEVYFNSPSIPEAVEGERLIRSTLDTTYGDFVAATPTLEPEVDQEEAAPLSAEQVKTMYWEQAQHVGEISGAKPVSSIDEYFHVGQDRSEGAIRQEVRAAYAPDSPPSQLLYSVEAYAAAFDLDMLTAAQITTAHLKTQLPVMKSRAHGYATSAGYTKLEASALVFREFNETMVPTHIERAQDTNGRTPKHQLQKAIPDFGATEVDDLAPALRLRTDDAKGIMSVYRLERRPFSSEELALGEEVVQQSKVQAALLLFQMAAVDYTSRYFDAHPERLEHSLLPFSEFFVPNENFELVPNPKLMKVLCNNLGPAIASQLIKDGSTVESLTSAHLAGAAQEAKERRVFYAQIGKFNNHDPETDTVELDAFFNRTCPAMQVLTGGLTHWLPHIYDRLQTDGNQ